MILGSFYGMCVCIFFFWFSAATAAECKFGVVQCKIPSQNGPERLDIPMRESLN